ncbi:Uncharacterised protein [Chlamydia trachomatis]|nr:Uncharacterised protein [Chlamydia trachomatis]
MTARITLIIISLVKPNFSLVLIINATTTSMAEKNKDKLLTAKSICRRHLSCYNTNHLLCLLNFFGIMRDTNQRDSLLFV